MFINIGYVFAVSAHGARGIHTCGHRRLRDPERGTGLGGRSRKLRASRLEPRSSSPNIVHPICVTWNVKILRRTQEKPMAEMVSVFEVKSRKDLTSLFSGLSSCSAP